MKLAFGQPDPSSPHGPKDSDVHFTPRLDLATPIGCEVDPKEAAEAIAHARPSLSDKHYAVLVDLAAENARLSAQVAAYQAEHQAYRATIAELREKLTEAA